MRTPLGQTGRTGRPQIVEVDRSAGYLAPVTPPAGQVAEPRRLQSITGRPQEQQSVATGDAGPQVLGQDRTDALIRDSLLPDAGPRLQFLLIPPGTRAGVDRASSAASGWFGAGGSMSKRRSVGAVYRRSATISPNRFAGAGQDAVRGRWRSP